MNYSVRGVLHKTLLEELVSRLKLPKLIILGNDDRLVLQ
jgi:hypothetical protein